MNNYKGEAILNPMNKGLWMVNCSHECRRTIRMTDNIQESYAGGTCEECWTKQVNSYKFQVVS